MSSQVLNVAYAIVAALCAGIGAAGYHMYGSGAADVVIFNLPAGFLATLCSCVVLINPVAKFALTMEPVAAAATAAVGRGKAVVGLQRLAVRTVIATIILMAARSVPFLAYVMALVGSFLTVSVSVTFPAICHLVRVLPAYFWLSLFCALCYCMTVQDSSCSLQSTTV